LIQKLHHISVQAALRSYWSIFSGGHQWLGFGTQAAFGTYLRVTGGFRKAGTSFLKRATEKIYFSCKLCHRSKQQLYFDTKTKSAHSKSTALIFRTFKKYTHSKSSVLIFRTFNKYLSRDTLSIK
jgi:hypothetical protein